jgi:DNA polymerase III subunit chi
MRAIFYILENNILKTRDFYLCRLVEKAYNDKHKIYINTSSLKETQDIDAQLWTFRDISFVPHKIINANDVTQAVILIGYAIAAPAYQNDILINLAPEIPAFYNQFQHIITIVPNDENLRNQSRKHYQYYKQNGLQVETHNVK